MTTPIDNALSSLVAKMAKLRLRTVERGVSEAEYDTSARMLGQLLMKHPEIQLTIRPQPEQPRRFTPTDSSTDWIVLEGCELVRKTDKAILFLCDGGEFWCPKSVVDFGQSYFAGGYLCVRKWFYQKELAPIFEGVSSR